MLIDICIVCMDLVFLLVECFSEGSEFVGIGGVVEYCIDVFEV